MGRPRKPFDWKKLDTILKFNASLIDAANELDVSDDIVENRIKEKYGVTFTEYRNKKMGSVRVALVTHALNMAHNGNATMTIFCLKNLCGWADQTRNYHEFDGVEFEDD